MTPRPMPHWFHQLTGDITLTGSDNIVIPAGVTVRSRTDHLNRLRATTTPAGMPHGLLLRATVPASPVIVDVTVEPLLPTPHQPTEPSGHSQPVNVFRIHDHCNLLGVTSPGKIDIHYQRLGETLHAAINLVTVWQPWVTVLNDDAPADLLLTAVLTAPDRVARAALKHPNCPDEARVARALTPRPDNPHWHPI